jgi:hypothetical protein
VRVVCELRHISPLSPSAYARSATFDPLNELDNIQQAVDRPCVGHQNTWTAEASIRGRRRG